VPGFEDRAAVWVRLDRAEGLDSYWAYREEFFQLLPPPARVLVIGCGEGRVARDLRVRGYEVTGLDVATTLVAAARDLDSSSHYVLGDAAELPFEDGEFPLVVAYNSLVDVDDLESAVREAARVLQPGGQFCVCVPHPFSDAGEFVGDDVDAPFVVGGSYLARTSYELVSDRNGIVFRFACNRYPLETYMRALEEAGLVLEALCEPALPGPGSHRRRRIPLFLLWRAAKPPIRA
jgi:SAM-dependent methyltransferase